MFENYAKSIKSHSHQNKQENIIRMKSGVWLDYQSFCQTLPPVQPVFQWGADPPFPSSPHLTGLLLWSTLHALERESHYCSVITHSTFHTPPQSAICVDAFHLQQHSNIFLFPSILLERIRLCVHYDIEVPSVLHTVVWWIRGGMYQDVMIGQVWLTGLFSHFTKTCWISRVNKTNERFFIYLKTFTRQF